MSAQIIRGGHVSSSLSHRRDFSRMGGVVRALTLLRMLEESRQGRSVTELALATGFCDRTVRRNLTALQNAGYILWDEPQRGCCAGRWFAKPTDSREGT